MFSRDVCLLLSLTAFTVVSSGISVQAEMTNAADAGTMSSSYDDGSESVATEALSGSAQTPDSNIDRLAVDATDTQAQEATAGLGNVQMAKTGENPDADRIAQPTAMPAAQANLREGLPANSYVGVSDRAASTQPVPGTLTTSAAALKTKPSTSPLPQTALETQDSKVAQSNIDIGETNRSGPSYIGVGLNLDGGGLEVISKIGLTNTLSVRPVVDFADDATLFYVPVTYDFSLEDTDTFPLSRFSPYAGAGIAFVTGSGLSEAAILATGGVDFAINPQFTATARVDVGLDNAVGSSVTIGVGYNFSGF